MPQLTYSIDDEKITFNACDKATLETERDTFPYSERKDILQNQPCYTDDYSVNNLYKKKEFPAIKITFDSCVKIIVALTGTDNTNLESEKYHQFVNGDAHLRVVRQTRDLYSDIFGFDSVLVQRRLGELPGFALTDINPIDNTQHHIIARINRPHSDDFNRVHKDIYESYHFKSKMAQSAFFRIPVCGVEQYGSIPIAPECHLQNEQIILRYTAGSTLQV